MNLYFWEMLDDNSYLCRCGLNHESKEKVLDTKLYTVHSGEIRQEYPYRHCYSSCSLQTSIEEQGEEGLLQGTDSCWGESLTVSSWLTVVMLSPLLHCSRTLWPTNISFQICRWIWPSYRYAAVIVLLHGLLTVTVKSVVGQQLLLSQRVAAD